MQRRVLKWGVALGVSAALVAGAAATAAASVDARGDKERFCEEGLALGEDVISEGTAMSEETAAELQQDLTRLAKLAPSKSLAKAVKQMAAYYRTIADGTSPDDISVGELKDFGFASGKFGLYLTTKCLTEMLPDITLPDIDLPDVTLPDLGT